MLLCMEKPEDTDLLEKLCQECTPATVNCKNEHGRTLLMRCLLAGVSGAAILHLIQCNADIHLTDDCNRNAAAMLDELAAARLSVARHGCGSFPVLRPDLVPVAKKILAGTNGWEHTHVKEVLSRQENMPAEKLCEHEAIKKHLVFYSGVRYK